MDSILSLMFPLNGLHKLTPTNDLNLNEFKVISKSMILLGEASM